MSLALNWQSGGFVMTAALMALSTHDRNVALTTSRQPSGTPIDQIGWVSDRLLWPHVIIPRRAGSSAASLHNYFAGSNRLYIQTVASALRLGLEPAVTVLFPARAGLGGGSTIIPDRSSHLFRADKPAQRAHGMAPRCSSRAHPGPLFWRTTSALLDRLV